MLGRRDRSLLAFISFWIVIAAGCWVGVIVVRALRISGGSASVSTAHAQPVHHARAHRVVALTLASIFSQRPPMLAGYDRRKLWTLVATGDVIPARTVNWKMVTSGDFLGPFRPTAAYLRTGDITLINLESPLISGCQPTYAETFTFCGDPRDVEGLKYAGVDTACMANNHIGNFGDQGIQETWDHLRAAGIGYCGLGKVDHKRIRGVVVAFLAYNSVGQRFDYALARSEIRAARKTASVVVVSVHWGKEYVALPDIAPGIADDDPVKVGHWIIDSGADLVIGNHPHHLQPVELYHGHLITYAHGNFVFDQMFDDPGGGGVKQGVVGTYTFYGTHLIAVRYRPVHIYDYWQPRWAGSAEAQQILSGMYQSSIVLARRERKS
jgi:Bacterial capsule synthesis protein PGA_cap